MGGLDLMHGRHHVYQIPFYYCCTSLDFGFAMVCRTLQRVIGKNRLALAREKLGNLQKELVFQFLYSYLSCKLSSL
jgi:hypothetical protein